MGAETVATLVVVAILVAVLAVYILAIGFALRKLSFTLGTIVVGLRAIAQQTRPVGAVVGDIIGEVDVIEDALDGLIAAVSEAHAPTAGPAAPTGRQWPERSGGPTTQLSAEAGSDLVVVEESVSSPDYELDEAFEAADARTPTRRSSPPRRVTTRRRTRPTPSEMREAVAQARERMEADARL